MCFDDLMHISCAFLAFFHLFRCVLSSLLPLRSVGRSNFDEDLHNLITLIQKRHKNNDIAMLYIYRCIACIFFKRLILLELLM